MLLVYSGKCCGLHLLNMKIYFFSILMLVHGALTYVNSENIRF